MSEAGYLTYREALDAFGESVTSFTRQFIADDGSLTDLGQKIAILEPAYFANLYRLQMITLGVDRRRAKRMAQQLRDHMEGKRPLPAPPGGR